MSNISRREFLHLLAIASASGFALDQQDAFAADGKTHALYELPRFGNVHLLHMTDRKSVV